jgi:hypothetical protein
VFSRGLVILTNSFSHHPFSLNLSLIPKSTRPLFPAAQALFRISLLHDHLQWPTKSRKLWRCLGSSSRMESSSVRSPLLPPRLSHNVMEVIANNKHLLVTRCQKPDQKEFLKVCVPRQCKHLASGIRLTDAGVDLASSWRWLSVTPRIAYCNPFVEFSVSHRHSSHTRCSWFRNYTPTNSIARLAAAYADFLSRSLGHGLCWIHCEADTYSAQVSDPFDLRPTLMLSSVPAGSGGNSIGIAPGARGASEMDLHDGLLWT